MNLDVTCILLLLNTSNKKVFQMYFFSICLYTVFLSIEVILWDESSKLLYISDMFLLAPCSANSSDISFQYKPQWDGTQQNSIYDTRYNVLNTLLHNIYPLSFCSPSFSMHWWLKCCFTTTETIGLLGTGAEDVHLDFHTATELLFQSI